ncbi:DMT family transporter [Athalassotoga saccharophila]|uniref:DMT family transporter n=1 Tax=Athalassotoga saccharophila TaxID=1441386 RepID=UPI001379FF56|nr:DMT family transporter [Athalassotoga saccharophila]BBJ28416.1 putative amino-acid metabolite efflux pump [Athalassotoga saccharophila]
MNTKNNTLNVSLALLVIFFWGISFVAIKVVVSVIPPITMALFRFMISFLILWIFSKIRPNGQKLTRKAKALSALAGLWGITIYFIFENFGVNFTTPAQASILIATVPIFTILIMDVSRKKMSGILLYVMSFLSLIGVSIIILSNGFDFRGDVIGDLLVLVAAISWGMYTLYVEKLSGYDNLLTTVEMTKWGLIFLIPFSAVEMYIRKPNVLSFFRPDVILWLLFLGTLCSGFGYLIWNYAVRTVGSRTTSNFIYLIPVVSVIADAAILRNIPSVWLYIGGGVTMVGVIAGERLGRKEELS